MDKSLYSEMASLETRHWWFLGRRIIIFDVIKRFCGSPSGKALDVGLGTGINGEFLSKAGYLVDGVEDSDEAMRFVEKNYPSLSVLKTSFPSSSIRSESYKLVTMLDVIEHIEDDMSALKAAHRALVPGGHVVVTTPAFSFLWTKHDELAHHKRRYRKKDLKRKLEEAGFETIFISYFNFFLFPAISAFRILGKLISKEGITSDFSSTPNFLNLPFTKLFSSERFLMRYFSLPFGVSIIAVGKKPI